MTLTVEMVNKAKTNGGFIDQKIFKTAGKYGFDSLYLIETSMQVLDGYINHIRSLLRPTCDFVLVTRNGGQHNKLGELMSKLVFDATGQIRSPDSLSTDCGDRKFQAAEHQHAEHNLRGPET